MQLTLLFTMCSVKVPFQRIRTAIKRHEELTKENKE